MREEQNRWIDTHVHADGQSLQHTEGLMEVLNNAGTDLRLVVSPDGDLIENINNDAGGMMQAAELIHALTQQAPQRFYGSCCVNLNFLKESLYVMDECFGNLGFVMLGEMLGYIFGFDMNTDAGEAVVRKAVEYDVPVQIHLSTSNNPHQGHTSGIGQLKDIIGIAERVPEAKYVLAHMIGLEQDNPPIVAAYLDLIDEQLGGWPDNFWAEIINFHSPGVRMALERIPHNRLIAGTDWCTRIGPPYPPYGVNHLVWYNEECPYEPSVDTLKDFLRSWGATEDDVNKIAFENATALLKL